MSESPTYRDDIHLDSCQIQDRASRRMAYVMTYDDIVFPTYDIGSNIARTISCDVTYDIVRRGTVRFIVCLTYDIVAWMYDILNRGSKYDIRYPKKSWYIVGVVRTTIYDIVYRIRYCTYNFDVLYCIFIALSYVCIRFRMFVYDFVCLHTILL